MNNPICLLLLICIGPCLVACSSAPEKKGLGEVVPGTVLPKIVCEKDTTISFALYVPSDYNAEKDYPVIYAFDAQGNGSKPVHLFKEAAERYGYIVVGSNNSKNGIPANETMRFYEVMADEVLSRFSVDLTRVYTAGFSGGSRVASSIAIFKGGIAGVIGCSAGFPALNAPIEFKFDYIGFVGDEDMNYLEMQTLKDALQQSGYRHHLVVFSGSHDWPPASVIPEAFYWMEVNAMKDMKKAPNLAFVNDQLASWQREAESMEKAGKKYEAYLVYQKSVLFFDGLTQVSAQKSKVNELANSAEVKNALQSEEDAKKEEMELQTRYAKALQAESLEWWRKEVITLNSIADDTTQLSRHAIYKRLLGYLSLMAYSASNGSLLNGQYEQAARFIELYSIVDPANNEHAYMSAVLQAKLNNPNLTFIFLEKAVEIGFNDSDRFRSDTVFDKYKDDPRYPLFIEKLNENKK